MNKLQAMEVFVQVVDAGSFSRAADNMQLPKATVSTLIQGLEKALSIKLLHRTTRQVTVTADGAAYYERCTRILADVRDAEESLSHNRLNPGGLLRVEAPTGLASEILLPALPDFFERYPGIQLKVGSTDRTVDLLEEGVDCAVRAGELNDSTLIARRVGVMNLVTCAAPSYLEKYGMPQHPTDLQQHRGVKYFSAASGKVYDWTLVRGNERFELQLPSMVAFNDSNAYVRAGLMGMGIVRMPDYLLEQHLRDGGLVAVLPEWVGDPVPIHVVYPQNRHQSAKMRVFVEWVAEMFDNHPNMRLKAGQPR